MRFVILLPIYFIILHIPLFPFFFIKDLASSSDNSSPLIVTLSRVSPLLICISNRTSSISTLFSSVWANRQHVFIAFPFEYFHSRIYHILGDINESTFQLPIPKAVDISIINPAYLLIPWYPFYLKFNK